MTQEARKILGLPSERLTLSERINVALIRDAMLEGCSFESKMDAERYVREERIAFAIYLIVLLFAFITGGVWF